MASKILRRAAVEAYTGLSRSSLYAKLDSKSRYFDPDFPPPLRLGKRAVGWRESEIFTWMDSRESTAV
jgi:prophage regulatory protein